MDSIDMTKIENPTFRETEEFRDWIVGVLKMHEVNLSFEKKDGTLREMRCTKDLSLIPSDKHPKGTGKESNAVTVFDLDLQDWRAFTPKAVRQINFTI